MNKTTLASALAIALGATASAQAAQVTWGSPQSSAGNNFTMLNGGGGFVGGGANDVAASWDGTVFTNSSDYTGPTAGGDPLGGATTVSNGGVSSNTAFFGNNWTAHDLQVFAPGTYNFDTGLNGPGPNANGESGNMTATVGAGQVGVHMLFDWNGNFNIDVFNTWDLAGGVFGSGNGVSTNPSVCGTSFTPIAGANCMWDIPGADPLTVWDLVSIDVDGDGVPGLGMAAGGPFAGFNANFNVDGITITPPVVIPVPAAAWLFGSGLLGLVGVARRKKSKA